MTLIQTIIISISKELPTKVDSNHFSIEPYLHQQILKMQKCGMTSFLYHANGVKKTQQATFRRRNACSMSSSIVANNVIRSASAK